MYEANIFLMLQSDVPSSSVEPSMHSRDYRERKANMSGLVYIYLMRSWSSEEVLTNDWIYESSDHKETVLPCWRGGYHLRHLLLIPPIVALCQVCVIVVMNIQNIPETKTVKQRRLVHRSRGYKKRVTGLIRYQNSVSFNKIHKNSD